MAERGLRMRQGIEDVLDRWAVGMVGREKEDEDDNELDEIEENAQELRRLLPY
jgi:hypothetical protein